MKASLSYQDDRSDKVYFAAVVEKDDGFVVEFSYGRRGSTLTAGTKTPVPVPLAKAEGIFSKLVKEKLDKGYRASNDDAPAMVGVSNEKPASGILPQLLNPIDREACMTLIEDDEWLMQEKMNGERRPIAACLTKGIRGINKKGQIVPLPAHIHDEVRRLMQVLNTDRLELDGEQVGDHYWVFDLLAYSKDLTSESVECRVSQLHEIIAASDVLLMTPTAMTREAKRRLFEAVERGQGEGVVFKRRGSAYLPGRPNSGGDQLKFKLKESATVRVCTGREGKRSIGMEVLDVVTGLWRFVGNCTIPPNHAVPIVGDVVEVEYLYCVDCLFQPVYLGPRTDQDASDCTTTQLKYKPKGAA